MYTQACAPIDIPLTPMNGATLSIFGFQSILIDSATFSASSSSSGGDGGSSPVGSNSSSIYFTGGVRKTKKREPTTAIEVKIM